MTRKLTPAIFTRLDPVLDQGEILYGSGVDGRVYQIESGENDDGDTISAKWTSGWIDMGMPETIKEFHKLHIQVESLSSALTVDWSVDYGAASDTEYARMHQLPGYVWGAPATWGAPGVWGKGGNIAKKKMLLSFPQSTTGRAIQVTLSQDTVGGGFKITSFSILFRVSEQADAMGEV